MIMASIGTTFNVFIDELMAAGGRILELPLFMLLAVIGAFGLALVLGARRLSRKGSSVSTVRVVLVAGLVLGLLAVAMAADRKFQRLQTSVIELRTKTSTEAATLLNIVSKMQTKRRSFLFSLPEVQKELAETLGEVTIQPTIYDEATDFARIVIKRPLAQVFVAVVDLRNPAVEIKLGGMLDKKTLTSAFARENDCTVAINGEAGMSPMANSWLGDWKGNLVELGQVLLRESTKYPAPFLSFDRQNHADFTSAASTNRTLTPTQYNVTWGRWDALVNGAIPSGIDSRNRQPRTAMAISQDGSRLYLLVADGRQPSYSNGMTMAGVGQCLQSFGAYNGMGCDEGGSSCIYLKQFGGIANIPCDNAGQERATYTHFGIRLLEAK